MKPQLILPCIPAGATEINYRVGVWRADDLRMFRIVTSQLINSGGCRQTDILRTFGVSKSSIIRSLNKLKSEFSSAHLPPLSRCSICPVRDR